MKRLPDGASFNLFLLEAHFRQLLCFDFKWKTRGLLPDGRTSREENFCLSDLAKPRLLTHSNFRHRDTLINELGLLNQPIRNYN